MLLEMSCFLEIMFLKFICIKFGDILFFLDVDFLVVREFEFGFM